MTEHIQHDGILFLLVFICLGITLALIHLSVAVNLYKFSRQYEDQLNRKLLFVHSYLWIPIGLCTGLVGAIFVAVIIAISNYKPRE